MDQDTVDTPDTAIAEENTEDEVSDEKFISFLENLLSLKLKQRPKKNG